jgi:hypothetical protein
VVAINANKVKDDLLPAMTERAKAKGFNFPYLHDATQQVAKSYGGSQGNAGRRLRGAVCSRAEVN